MMNGLYVEETHATGDILKIQRLEETQNAHMQRRKTRIRS